MVFKGGFKVGFRLGLRLGLGLRFWVRRVHKSPHKDRSTVVCVCVCSCVCVQLFSLVWLVCVPHTNELKMFRGSEAALVSHPCVGVPARVSLFPDS